MNDMRKLMEAVEESLNEGNVDGYASAITNLIDAMAFVIAEDYHSSDTSLKIIINNVMHDATTEIKMRLPDRIRHYSESMQQYKDSVGESISEEVQPRQDSTKDQLRDLITLACQNGMYDAADYIELILTNNFKPVKDPM